MREGPDEGGQIIPFPGAHLGKVEKPMPELPTAAELVDLGLTTDKIWAMCMRGFAYPNGPRAVNTSSRDPRPTQWQLEQLGIDDSTVSKLLMAGFVQLEDIEAPLELKAHPVPARRADLGIGRKDAVTSLAAIENAAVERILKNPQSHRKLGRRRDK